MGSFRMWVGCGPNRPGIRRMGVSVSVKQPEFIVIGSQKAGTSSLFVGLNRHPQVYMAPEKELNYFYDDSLFIQGPHRYAEFFKDAPEDSICGEASPGYICHPRSPGRIHRQIPNVKLIVTLRDPVERAYSQYWDNRRQLAEGRTFGALLDGPQHQVFNPDRKNYFTRGLYSVYLERYLALFPREQLLIIQFDELKRTPTRCTGDASNSSEWTRTQWVMSLTQLQTCARFSPILVQFRLQATRFSCEATFFHQEATTLGARDSLYAGADRSGRRGTADYYAPYDRALESILGEAPYWASTSESLTAEAPEPGERATHCPWFELSPQGAAPMIFGGPRSRVSVGIPFCFSTRFSWSR